MKAGIVRKWSMVAAVALGLCLLTGYGPAAAAAGPDSTGEVKDLLYRFINFGLLVIVLVVVVRKARVKDFFEARKKSIRDRIESLEKQKDAAEARCSELEVALAAFESERAGIIQRFRAEGEAEKGRIIAEANEKARQILLQADAAVQREIKNAEGRLMGELAESVAEKAGKLIAVAVTERDQEFLVDEFIKKVERLH